MKCKWCLTEFDLTIKPKGWAANHSRWCVSNPKHTEYKDKLKKIIKNKGLVKLMADAKKLTGMTNQFTKANVNGITLKSKLKGRSNIALKGKKHSIQSKLNMSKGSLKSSHRRLRRGIIKYKGIMLDSSWELELAKRLDELNIDWNRPEPLKWKDKNNIEHNYFPDFYLPKYNLYLDPKNPAAYSVQKEKIDILLNTYNNILILKSISECKNFKI